MRGHARALMRCLHPAPTGILALQGPLDDGGIGDAVRSTLAFHPDTASDEHLLGGCYEAMD